MNTQEIYEAALALYDSPPGTKAHALDDFPSLAQTSAPRRLPGEPLGKFIVGDNLALMKAIGQAPGIPPVQLVYTDPPYFTNRERRGGKKLAEAASFSDRWRGAGGARTFEEAMTEYLTQLTARLIAARALLADDGCLWLHLDRHAVHYARVMADVVFGGPEHLINEVVWTYKSGGASARRFSNKHDTLLFYAKDKKRYKFFPQEEKSYNRGLKPYRFKGVKEWRDEMGWYTMVHMKDVWEIPMVGRTAAERTGYATQKPEALLERIVRACTEEGGLCLDPYAGSGTLGAVCARLSRPYILIDENPLAAEVAERRLRRQSIFST